MGCQGGGLSGTYPCEDGFGTCVGSVCVGTDCCTDFGDYTPCCPSVACDDPSGGCYPPGVCGTDIDEGDSCTSLSGVDGVCSLTPLGGGTFHARCVATDCAEEIPDGSGNYVEIDCDDGLECTEDQCDPDTGQCTNTPLPELTSCNGGDGVCLGDGVCVDVPEPCDLAEATCYPCTLQGVTDAIAAGGGPHEFACAGPEVVTITETLVLASDVSLDGGGLLTIEGNGADLLLQVGPGATVDLRAMTLARGIASAGGPGCIVNDGTLTLSDMTITECESSTLFGGPVHNVGSLTVLRSVFLNNNGHNGSGALSNVGSLNVVDSFFFDNRTTGDPSEYFSQGGALWSSGTATLTDTTIRGNYAAFGGGGIYNSGLLDLTRSTVSNNTAALGLGGGIWNVSPGDLTLVDSEVDDNVAVDRGGGICNEGVGFDITGGSVSGNVVTDPGVATGFGGGIATEGADVTLTGVRIADNQAIGDDAEGGGISSSDFGSVTLVDCMLIGNSAVGVRADGGGAYLNAGTSPYWISQTTIFGNYSERWGGGLHLLGEGGSITDSVIDSNVAGDDGGGFRSFSLVLSLLRTTVSDNRSGDDGGGVASRGTSLRLTDSDVSGNQAVDDGGGISVTGGLVLERTTVQTNFSAGEGGGMHVGSPGDVSVTDASSVSQNSANGSGGGIRVFRSTLVVSDSTIDGNGAGSVGGGISSYGDTTRSAVVTIERSTVSSNTAVGSGGGVESQWTRNTLTIEETAIVGNRSLFGGGGGVYVQDGATAFITNSTFSENLADDDGDGLLVRDSNTEVDLIHVTFAENGPFGLGDAVALDAGDVNVQNTLFYRNRCTTTFTSLTSLGGNIEAGGDWCDLSVALGDGFFGPSTLNLSALGDNGGPTVSYLPGPGSTAIDFSPCIADVTTEQRGINSRPQGAACDCGAVEAP